MPLPAFFLKRVARAYRSGGKLPGHRRTRTRAQERARRNRQIQIDIRVIGDKELQRDMRKLPNAMQKKIARNALTKGARLVGEAAQAEAPTDTGKLAASMRVFAGRRSRSRISRHAVFGVGVDRLYSAAVELGTRLMDPLSFLRDAADQNAGQVIEMAGADIGKSVDEVMRR